MSNSAANVVNMGHRMLANRILRRSLKKQYSDELPAACFDAEQAYIEGGARDGFVAILEQACRDYPDMEQVIRVAWSPAWHNDLASQI